MVTLEHLTKYYGAKNGKIYATDDLSMEINAGEMIVITGHSGSGKTTLLNLIGGMTRPNNGEINVAGCDLNKMTDRQLSKFRANSIGFIIFFGN